MFGHYVIGYILIAVIFELLFLVIANRNAVEHCDPYSTREAMIDLCAALFWPLTVAINLLGFTLYMLFVTCFCIKRRFF